MSPLDVFRRAAVAEALTWALLLVGMFVKYGTEAQHQGELGVRVFGMAHGVVFLAYCLVTLVVAVDQRWSARRLLLGLASAVPPFMTLWFERYAGRHGLAPASWRLRDGAPANPVERVVAWLLAHPAGAAVSGAAAGGVLTAAALTVGPPAG